MYLSPFIPPPRGDFDGLTVSSMIEWAPPALVALAVAAVVALAWRRRGTRVK